MHAPYDRMNARGFRSVSLPSLGSFRLSLTVLYAIGHRLVFSLGGWSPRLRAGFFVPCATPGRPLANPHPKGLSPARAPLSSEIQMPIRSIAPAYPALPRFGLLPLRSPLLGESRLISSPPGNWMFRFPGFAPASLRVSDTGPRGCPIRKPRGHWMELLALAFRRCPRPSSPADA
jgi:hypothetical protein